MTDDNTKAVLAEFQASHHEHAGPIYDHERMAAEIVRLRALVRDAHREGMRAVHDDHIDYDEEQGWEGSAARKALEGGMSARQARARRLKKAGEAARLRDASAAVPPTTGPGANTRHIARLREVVGCGIARVSVAGFADSLRLDEILKEHDRVRALVRDAYIEGWHAGYNDGHEGVKLGLKPGSLRDWADSEANREMDGSA